MLCGIGHAQNLPMRGLLILGRGIRWWTVPASERERDAGLFQCWISRPEPREIGSRADSEPAHPLYPERDMSGAAERSPQIHYPSHFPSHFPSLQRLILGILRGT